MGLQSALAASPSDTLEGRQSAAERYLAVAPFGRIMKDAIGKSAPTLPPEKRESFQELMTRYVRIDVLEAAAKRSMVRHFTARELNALADFYGSPEGRSAMRKFGDYMADVMPVVQQEMARAYRQYNASR
jgi:hypothetical protein